MSDPHPPRVSHATLALDRALEALRIESALLNTPRDIEDKLMAAFATRAATASPLRHQAKTIHTPPRASFTRFFGQWFAPGAAIAASVVMASWMMLSPLSQVGNEAELDATAAAVYASDTGNPFIALQSLERIALEPTPRLIAAFVPRTSLAAYGVPINPEMAGQSIRTEMLVAANGQPLAMRFLP